MHPAIRLIPAARFYCTLLPAQLNTGRLVGSVRGPDGQALARAAIAARGSAGLAVAAHTDARGRFALVLPYGSYRISVERNSSTLQVRVAPLRTVRVEIQVLRSGELQNGR